MKQAKEIHAYTLRSGIDHSKTLITNLLHHHHHQEEEEATTSNNPIDCLSYAHKLFIHHCPNPTLFLYNKLLHAFSSHHLPLPCFQLYTRMSLHGFPPNPQSFTFLFSAAAASLSRPTGSSLHGRFIKSGLHYDVIALTALMDMYAKLGFLSNAREVFDEMPDRDPPAWNSMIAGYSRSGDMAAAVELFRAMPCRNLVSWTAVISGYSQNGMYSDALGMFLQMEEEAGLKPNQVTVASVLPACANLGALEVGERIEAYARENGFFSNVFVSNAILEMYAKCGKIDSARQVFDEIGSRRRNLCSWNSMIMGLASHGRCSEVLQLYTQMQDEGVNPDDVTFVGLLLACTHGGLTLKGKELFKSMNQHHNIIPKLQHYGCMVDLLGRAGRLQEAYDLIKTMPITPDAVIWGALLGACSFHGNLKLAEIAAECLVKLEPLNPGNFVILSNIYASAGKWEGVAKLRKSMRGDRIVKAAGYSSINDEGGRIHKFVSGDRSHLRSVEIYSVLHQVLETMRLQRNESDQWERSF